MLCLICNNKRGYKFVTFKVAVIANIVVASEPGIVAMFDLYNSERRCSLDEEPNGQADMQRALALY